MRIHRIKHARYFTVLGNGTLRKHELSFCARGLLGYLLSLPDASREDVRTLAAKSREGRTAISNALRELESAGHYVRDTARDPLTGQVRTTVDVYEVPVMGKAQHTVPPLPVSPAAGRPGAGEAAVGKPGSPPLEVRTTAKDVGKGPSVPPSNDAPEPEFWDEPGDVDSTEAAEAHATFSTLLGGTDGVVVAEVPNEPSAPRQSPPAAAPRTARPTRTTEGVELLLELGRREPQMALSGQPLMDQGAMVEGLLAAGWTRGALMSIVSAPLPSKIRTSVAAVLARRIALIPVNPPTQAATAVTPKQPAAPRSTRVCDDCKTPLSTLGRCGPCDGPASSPRAVERAPLPAGGWRERVGLV
ncbi:hypothetical protein [Kitasatospora sp. NPDC050543]|uniref:hypothetical protein n=1 Tax=Kitasatospora sp. NPDC050543 TaxID=3364054 RepID=UPI003797CEB9